MCIYINCLKEMGPCVLVTIIADNRLMGTSIAHTWIMKSNSTAAVPLMFGTLIYRMMTFSYGCSKSLESLELSTATQVCPYFRAQCFTKLDLRVSSHTSTCTAAQTPKQIFGAPHWRRFTSWLCKFKSRWHTYTYIYIYECVCSARCGLRCLRPEQLLQG